MSPLGSESAHRASGVGIGVVRALSGNVSLPCRVNITLHLRHTCWGSCRRNQRRNEPGPALSAHCTAPGAAGRTRCDGRLGPPWALPGVLFSFPLSIFRHCACCLRHVHFSRSETSQDPQDNVIKFNYSVLVCNVLARYSIFWRRDGRGDIWQA